MYTPVEDMSEMYSRPLPKVYAIFLFAIEYSAKAQPPQHTTTGARLGRGWAYIFDIFSKSIFPKNPDTAWHGIFMTRHDMAWHGMPKCSMARGAMTWHGTGPPCQMKK